MPVWRSMLFVPAHVQRFVSKAHSCGADAIILDLEDSVPLVEKANARSSLITTVHDFPVSGPDIIVRINRPWRLSMEDIEAATLPGVKAFMVPKIHSAAHVQLLSEVIEDMEDRRGIQRGTIRLFPLIESLDAFHAARDIAMADPRVCAMMLGPEDFSLASGMRPVPEALLFPSQQVLFAARAARVTPYGCISTVTSFKDPVLTRDIMRRSFQLGFEGASCIHPSQIPILNEEFSPSESDFKSAQRIIAAFDLAVAEGKGAMEVGGNMIDWPVVERARRLAETYKRRRQS
jgi:citrate lyase subunit beta/citryl-CoA lyase